MSTIDFDRLLKLRLVVARHGEMDRAKWWNTNGVLSRKGRLLLGRGLPRTHRFAQARLVFTVARARCEELFHPPECMTLWKLPADLEDEFDARWQDWLEVREEWVPFLERLEEPTSDDLLELLRSFGLVTDADVEAASRLRRSAEGRAVPLTGTFEPTDEVLTLLAAGFARGEPGKPAIPYARLAT